MKIIRLLIALVILFALAVTSVYAGTFFDNFDDGDTEGWIAASPSLGYGVGNWRIEEGVLLQDQPGDHFKFLLQDLPVSTQTVETDLYSFGPAGYGGVTVWYKDYDNWVDVYIYGGIDILEKSNGIVQVYHYLNTAWHDNTLYNLRVDADGATGELKVYVNNTYILTHSTNVNYRLGLSGVKSGNSGGYFDNFKITYNDISPVSVGIDIRPHNKHNFVPRKGRGILPVAIFSTENFDAPSQIDQTSLTFGANGDEQSLAFCSSRPRDINRDGSRDDLMCYFLIKKAGFQCGDAEGILTGKTVSGVSIEGRDSIKVIRCK